MTKDGHPHFGYHVPAGRMDEVMFAHPERMAYRQCADDCGYVFKSWTNRPAMLKSIEMQERAGTPNAHQWRDYSRSRFVA